MPNRVHLGHTGTELTNLGFGAWGIGGNAYGPTDDDVSRAALTMAFELGVRFYDTADVYGDGRSERLIGEALGRFRDSLVIATKVGFNFYDGSYRGTFDADYIRNACQQSLDRLGTHFIDIYQLHNPPQEVLARGEALATLVELQRAGKIRVPAVSVAKAEDAHEVLRHPEYKAIQIIYNLIDQRPRTQGILDAARLKGVGIIARVPLAYGFLTGKYHPGHQFGPLDHRAKKPQHEIDRYLHRAERLLAYSTKGGTATTPTELALRFCISHPGVTTVIPGLKTPSQVREAVHAIDRGPLQAAVLEEIYGLGLAWASEDAPVGVS
ncbi:MAG TPA: aldo/keto reductase [bacterium]|nr:aldo/keto reductase [bacterium]